MPLTFSYFPPENIFISLSLHSQVSQLLFSTGTASEPSAFSYTSCLQTFLSFSQTHSCLILSLHLNNSLPSSLSFTPELDIFVEANENEKWSGSLYTKRKTQALSKNAAVSTMLSLSCPRKLTVSIPTRSTSSEFTLSSYFCCIAKTSPGHGILQIPFALQTASGIQFGVVWINCGSWRPPQSQHPPAPPALLSQAIFAKSASPPACSSCRSQASSPGIPGTLSNNPNKALKRRTREHVRRRKNNRGKGRKKKYCNPVTSACHSLSSTK